ncbi:DNA repair protein RecO [Candidatus Giovannonibacteria bacterium RIFCSPHIGHO2_02_43_13]|uniref:DNA repair protein RecO n=1 Tax=Candidatus Giovannonibacteria bacterium RIFCSPHIGHO2_02_43_13 TaxID=1798330 RepID=A0A1F5WS05_9BACT|nr:MAG: repair protein RecO protein [Parcubacteria group bacterium GW2011_GWA2_44_13]OGF73268.1 MAG: DNA repair protein RecO [Candidatus Giovannonibacteria bacterium RIFCSPHIGHO2_12_FULL_44_42]OGF78456.1 MAG: DNA repair protein RecO [Candidatus Giovannonibacteria bacterium RIFCSPHIGHO2_02_43_13]OGF88644.1 MAG: DNA repair protein RecO [Candidatus Giovannonibacteria bacterium RIFCSPLOWO2_02_FULL_43_54]OGF97559.1 MAG: DNA repair protein RecO [Candidatus Giovannonibacteria bacterium RIFCSPLOWO2_12_
MKKMPFAEADFLVRILTKDFGKIDILAKGARKSASKLNLHLDILNHVRISFVKNSDIARDRIPTLTDAEVISRYDDWFLNSQSLSVAGRVLQVLDLIILHHSKDEELFLLTVDFFSTPPVSPSESTRVDILEESAIKFLRSVFAHEGHGDTLPPEQFQNIIKLWPVLRKLCYNIQYGRP